MKSTLRSRKLIFASILLLISTGFVMTNKASFSEWSDFMNSVFLIYVGGNLGTKASNHLLKKGEQNDDTKKVYESKGILSQQGFFDKAQM